MRNAFKRALVALDLSSMDRELFRYFSEIYQDLGIQEVYFVHIAPDFNTPGKEDARFAQLFNPEDPIDEKIKEKIINGIQEAMGTPEDLKVHVEVIEGKPHRKLMHWLEVKKINLLIVGKKPISEGSGITAKRLARQAECHVLFVAPRARGKWRSVVIPIDFSAYSQKSLDFALQVQEKDPSRIVKAIYVVEMPLEDYYTSSGMYPQYRPLLMESATEAYQLFIEKHGIDSEKLEMEFLENTYGNVSGHIAEYTMDDLPDLLIIGAQGHTGLDRFLFGSVTEKLLEKVKGLSVMLIR